MNTYLKTLMLMMAACQILLMVSSELLGDHTKKAIRFLYGVVMILTLFSPLREFAQHISGALDKITAEETETEQSAAELRAQTITESAYMYIAEEWIQYITEQYDVSREQICIHLITDEADILRSAEIILRNCPYVIRRNIENDIGGNMEIPVVIKGE